ncbi:MAG TPA: hypothetical protein PLQ97_03480 [Myxococcota bacterium]|nr:hypothetical protein [Myxococcota bacterium]HQK50083.1 hypothetical protein [Myxococcota bacterium]
MTRREKIALLILVAGTLVGAVGVYLWYQADLAAQVDERGDGGAVTDQVALLLSQRPPRQEEARKRLLEAPEAERWDALDRLATRSNPEERLVAVQVARVLRDRPRARALLARLAQSDPDQKVQVAARKALAGEAP